MPRYGYPRWQSGSAARYCFALTDRVTRASQRGKLIAVAAALIGVSATIALGIHLLTSRPISTRAPAVVASGAHDHAVSPISDKSIAVLPFTDMSEKKD